MIRGWLMRCISREVVVVGGFPFLLCLLVLSYSKASTTLNQLRSLPCSDCLDTNFEPLPRLRYHIPVTNISYAQPRPLHILFDVHHSFLDYPPCYNDDVAVLQRHFCCRILVRDCSNHTLDIPFGVHDPNMGPCLLVDERSLDC